MVNKNYNKQVGHMMEDMPPKKMPKAMPQKGMMRPPKKGK